MIPCFLDPAGHFPGILRNKNKLVGVASGACAQRNIRLSTSCVDLLVVRSSCHASFAWPSVLVKQGNTVPYGGECMCEQIFGATPGRCSLLLSKKHVINFSVALINTQRKPVSHRYLVI